jgi:hypothetical protein
LACGTRIAIVGTSNASKRSIRRPNSRVTVLLHPIIFQMSNLSYRSAAK